jgi:uncharacterized membrane protein
MATPQEELDALRAQVAALTARVHRLEQGAGIQPQVAPAPTTAPPVSTAPPPPPPPVQPRPVVPPPLTARPASSGVRDTEALEGKIGKVWISRIGIIAILFGVAYFIKYAFDNNWIGAAGRVTIGVIAGIAVILWSERFRNKGYAAFSYSLKGLGIGILYLAFWAASQYFHPPLIPVQVSFVAMTVVTAVTVILGLKQDAEILVVFALIGGFCTPAALSTNENHEIILFSYVALLDLAILATSIYKPWRRLMWGSFIGTIVMYVGWSVFHYTSNQRNLTVGFAALFAAIFAVIPLVTPLQRSRWHRGHSVTLTLLPLFNAAAFFLALFDMYEHEKATLTWYALALAGIYLGLASLLRRRTDAEPDTLKLVNLLHVAIAIAFITIAIPLKADAQWITIGWLVESAVLLLIAVRTKADFLRYFSAATLALGVIRLLIIDSAQLQPRLVLNARFATYLVAVAILAGIVVAGERVASSREMPLIKLAGIGLNLLALIGLTLEAHDYFTRQRDAISSASGYTKSYAELNLAWDFSYSAIWLVYGAGMMAFGFWKRDSFVRWQALVLMALTIGKVFTYDTWSLGGGYRILSFIGLGVILLAISFIYQRDWLKLSPSSSDKAAKGTSV